MSGKPLVIAHRGASGYLPEHTLEAKALAVGQGADFLEQDVVATRDGELVVLHDLYLDDVTDVKRHFPERHRADGRYYVIDFELVELRRLSIVERRRPGTGDALFPERFPAELLAAFKIVTLDEELQFVRGISHSTGRRIGIYPEIKAPRWHAEHGVDLPKLLIDKLGAYGYSVAGDAVFVQCFDPTALRRVRAELGSELKLVQLVDDSANYRDLLTDSGLESVAEYADGLGPAYAQLVDIADQGWPHPSRLAADARSAGLVLHPYTFRRDRLPPYAASLEELLLFFLSTVRVHGVFCDHPDIAARVCRALGEGASVGNP